jgi:hypothetical protein
VDDLLDGYYVNMDSHAWSLSSATMPVTSVKNEKTTTMAAASSERAQLQILNKNTTLKKATVGEKRVREIQNQKTANVKKKEGKEEAARTWQCKKNDGKGWNCRHNASHPNSLCEYHLMKKRSYLNLQHASPAEEDKAMAAAPTSAASKPSSSSNTQKTKLPNNYDANEGFYYYHGFRPSRGKRRCRNHPKNDEEVKVVEPSKSASLPSHAKVEIEDASTSNGATAGGDDVCNDNNSGRGNVNNMDQRNQNPLKLPRKPVKVRLLMSL